MLLCSETVGDAGGVIDISSKDLKELVDDTDSKDIVRDRCLGILDNA